MSHEVLNDSTELRKARGAFFTPPGVCRYIASWAVRSPDETVMEPSCGDGAILQAVAVRLKQLGGTTPVTAYELHEPTARMASAALSAIPYQHHIQTGDFLAVPARPAFSAIVGNPPYIRFQEFTGEARATALAAALAQGVRLGNMASSWAAFVVHASAFLAPGGRLALVLPGELLSSNYAQAVRDFLLQRFASVRVLLFGQQVFPGVQTESLLLMAEGQGTTDTVQFGEVHDARKITEVTFDQNLPTGPGRRWTNALVSGQAAEAIGGFEANGDFVQLDSWGRLALGGVTGNNRFFTLSPHEVDGLGLKETDVIPISPAGSGHLRALALTPRMHTTLGSAGVKTFLFRPENPSPAARAYIRQGEAQGIDQAYKCRVRDPWWRVPLPRAPHLFFTYMNAGTPQLADNPMGLHHLNSVHGVYLSDELRTRSSVLALACLNSATALSAETRGRAYGGGILKMEPREAARLLVPSPEAVAATADRLAPMVRDASEMLTAGRLTDVRAYVDQVVLVEGMGLDQDDLDAVRASHDALSSRRHLRATSRSTA